MRPWCGRQCRGSDTVGHHRCFGCSFGARMSLGDFGAPLLFGEGEERRWGVWVRAGQLGEPDPHREVGGQTWELGQAGL